MSAANAQPRKQNRVIMGRRHCDYYDADVQGMGQQQRNTFESTSILSATLVLSRMKVVQADITAAEIDAIVNAASESLLGGGGVDYAIHQAAGPGLLDECRSIPEVSPGVRCPTGESRATSGHRLRAKHIIHTVGPVWIGGGGDEERLLQACYCSSLSLAVVLGVRTIAFPGISCGNFGYPLEDAARVAIDAIAKFLRVDRQLEKVVLMDIDDEVVAALRHQWSLFCDGER